MREVRLALLEADVNFKVVKDFVARVRERAVGAEVLESLTAGQQVVKIVHEELIALLSARRPDVPAEWLARRSWRSSASRARARRRPPAKLARHIVKQGRRPLLVAADPYRPAAADQLQTLGKSLDIPVYRAPRRARPSSTSPAAASRHARRTGRDVVILDTAGRLTVDEALMAEIAGRRRRRSSRSRPCSSSTR